MEPHMGPFSTTHYLESWKIDRFVPAVHAELYSLSALDWVTGPGTCVKWSIGPPW